MRVESPLYRPYAVERSILVPLHECPPWLRGTSGGSYSGAYDHPQAPSLPRRGIKIEFLHNSPPRPPSLQAAFTSRGARELTLTSFSPRPCIERARRAREGRRLRRRARQWGLWCLLVLAFGRASLAQESSAEVKASADPRTITVGDIVQFNLEVIHPQSVKISFPAVGPGLNEWVVRNTARLPAKEAGPGKIAEFLQLQLTIYRTGDLEIPSLNVEVVSAQGEKQTRSSSPIKIKVQSVLDGEQLKEIKAQAEISPDYKPFLFLLTALAALALIVYKVVRFLKQRRAREIVVPGATRSPAELAREAIQKLLAKRLVETGYLKEFYLELSEILKRYLGSKLGIVSLERTSEEFVGDLRAAAIPWEEYVQIKGFLMDCDLVKFAKYRPSSEEIGRIVERASEIIDAAENRKTAELAAIEVSNGDRG